MLPPAISVWMQALLAGAVAGALCFQHDLLGGSSIMVAHFLYGAVALCAGALAVDAVLWRLRHRARRHYISALALAAAIGPLFPWANAPFCWLSAAQKLSRNEKDYERCVREVQLGGSPREVYMVDAGPPQRIAFLWGGISDNWFGVVHDASGSMGMAPQEVLGGRLVQVIHLWGPWFYAAFT